MKVLRRRRGSRSKRRFMDAGKEGAEGTCDSGRTRRQKRAEKEDSLR